MRAREKGRELNGTAREVGLESELTVREHLGTKRLADEGFDVGHYVVPVRLTLLARHVARQEGLHVGGHVDLQRGRRRRYGSVGSERCGGVGGNNR